MSVRVIKKTSGYYSPLSQHYSFEVGEVVGGDMGVFLSLNASADVEALDEPSLVVETVTEVPETVEPAAPVVATPSPEPVTPGADADVVEVPAVSDLGPSDAGESLVSDEPSEGLDFDPELHNGAEVIAYAKDHPEFKAELHALELAGKARTTVLAALA